MSETTPSGLDKLSANKALTFLAFIACFTSSYFVISTRSVSQPKDLKVFVNCVIDPPYSLELATIF